MNIGILTSLQAIFIFCKLAGVTKIAGWSWWLILSPTLGPLTLIFTFFLLVIMAKITLNCFDD